MSGSSNFTDEENALREYGKKALTDSVETIKAFISIMIPLTTGLITVYFALLEFLGISKAGEGASAAIGSWDIILPEILMLISLIGYIGASFPVPKSLVIDNITNIRNYRKAALWWKYIWMLGATVFFFLGLGAMINIATRVIGGH